MSDRPAIERTSSKTGGFARTDGRTGQSEPDELVRFLTSADPILVEEAVRNFTAYLDILKEWDRRERAEEDERKTGEQVIVRGRADVVDSSEEIVKR